LFSLHRPTLNCRTPSQMYWLKEPTN